MKPERDRVSEVIDRINEQVALPKGILLDPWLWEVDAPPDIGEPQQSINKYLEEAAIMILILWNRMGTPTSKGLSGTVEEYGRALTRLKSSAWPRVLTYYSQRKGKPLNDDQTAQRKNVLDFQKDHPEIFAATYNNTAEFAAKLEKHLVEFVNQIAAPPTPLRRYKKLLYVKVTYLRVKADGVLPVYRRTVERFAEDVRKVDVFDEAVYYTLEIFPSKKKVERRTDQSSGVVDPRMMIPLQYPLVSGDKHAARAANAALMDVNSETDTLLTISHFENGLQGKEQEFGSRVEEDAEYARMILDFSSIPDAKTLVQQQSAWLTRDRKDQAAQIVPLGESIYMVSCEDAKAGDYLGMSVTIVR